MIKKSNNVIYLDNNASTQVDPRVFDVMKPFFYIEYGNPHSASHSFGRSASNAIENAKQNIANLLDSGPDEVIFTSGATEANNLVLNGIAQGWGTGKPRLLVLSTEHPSVIEPALKLQSLGHELVLLPVDRDGNLDLEILENELTKGPSLVSIGAANGEIGTIQPINDIGKLCSKSDALFHCDASQAAGKIPVRLYGDGIDFLTLSAHKIYGPKGIGALLLRNDIRRFIVPQVLGGGQQGGIRSGTLPTPLCVGLGQACLIATLEMEANANFLLGLQELLITSLAEAKIKFQINGSLDRRIPGNLNITLTGIDIMELISCLPELAISAGSACSSHSITLTPSHVLKSIALSDSEIKSSFRLGIGRFNKIDDINRTVDYISRAIKYLKETGT